MIDDELTDGDLIYLDDTPITNVETLRKLIAYLYDIISEMEMDLEERHDENTALYNKCREALKENQELKLRLVEKIASDAEKEEKR